MRKRPLIPVAVLYVAGILLARFPAPLLLVFSLAFVLLLLCVFWNSARRYLLCALLLLAGWLNLAEHTAMLSPNDLRVRFPRSEEIVMVRGVLSETPYHRVHSRKNIETWSSMAKLRVTGVRRGNGDWLPAVGEAMSSTKEFLPDTFFAGQIVEATGVIRKTRGPVAEGLFDYREFLRYQGIYYQLEIKKVLDWQIIASPSQPPLADRFCAWARKAIALGLPGEDPSLRLEWALTLGWKAALTDEVAEPFMKAATFVDFASRQM